METEIDIFDRARLLLGTNVMQALSRTRVALFGVGGVGSWCAEGLVRTGVGHLLLVDPDTVCPSNVNRQLMATMHTLGRPKAEVLRQRLLDICPQAHIEVRAEAYTAATSPTFGLDGYDYIIDAIDSLPDKALLIRQACLTRGTLFSSMGAALKLDPTKISVAEFWKVRGCPLAAALRRRFKREGQLPRRKFRCVYSEELVRNRGAQAAGADGSAGGRGPNGSLVHATAVFGFTLAGLVVQDVERRATAHEGLPTEVATARAASGPTSSEMQPPISELGPSNSELRPTEARVAPPQPDTTRPTAEGQA